MPITADERRVILAYQGNVARIRSSVERFLRAVWSGMENYRDRDIDRMVARVAPVVLGAQRQTAAVTSAYLAAVTTAVLGTTVRPRPVRAVGDLRGVPSSEVYRRPGVTVWTALSDGKPLSNAVSEGRSRLLSLAAMDLQLAKTHAARDVFARDTWVVGYQRVLTGADANCGLCVLASTQRYRTEDLLPIHPGCQCDVRPLYGSEDPGQVINSERLEQLHDSVEQQLGVDADRGGRAPDYRDIAVREHGEYGPTLSWRGQEFTGPADI